jgi:hypothetical protein
MAEADLLKGSECRFDPDRGHDRRRSRVSGRGSVGGRLCLIEECGRHTGHADLLREEVDGLVGADRRRVAILVRPIGVGALTDPPHAGRVVPACCSARNSPPVG